jgi:hypothetical protein
MTGPYIHHRGREPLEKLIIIDIPRTRLENLLWKDYYTSFK